MVRQELSASDSYQQSEQTAEQQKALQYYNAGPRGDEKVGGSKLVSADVADMTEAILAQLVPMLSDATISFEPHSEEDEDHAQRETNAVRRAVFQGSTGFVQLVTGCKDALLMRNGIMRVRVERDETTHDQTYYEVDIDAIGVLLTDIQRGEVGREMVGEPELVRSEGDREIYNVTIRHQFEKERLSILARKPENIRIAQGWDQLELDGLRFFAEFDPVERGELVEEGISRKVVAELPTYTYDVEVPNMPRMPAGDQSLVGGYDWSTELVARWDAYVRVDRNGDGIAELWRVWYVGNRVIRAEEVPFIPYCLGVVLIRGHEWAGVAPAERLFGVQDWKTGIVRQWMENLRYHNSPKPAVVENQVNLGDLADDAANGWVRVKHPDALRDRPVVDVGPSAALALEWADKTRSERGGAALDLQTQEAAIAGHTAHGTERQYSSREQLAGMMARTFGETMMRGLFMLVHRVMRTQYRQELMLKWRGEWQSIDPRTWAERADLDVHMGQTQKDKDRRLGILREVLAQQLEALKQGGNGELVDLSKIHNTLTNFLDTAGVPATDSYWIDPRSPAAQQAAKVKSERAEAQAAAEEGRAAALLDASLAFEEYRVNVQSEDKDLDRESDDSQAADKLRLEYAKLDQEGNADAAA